MHTIQITKNSGELVPFAEDKLRHSLERSGAKSDTISEVIAHVINSLRPGITTREIYKTAHALLKQKEYHKASRYRLKQAVLELGPTGYPFELLVGELMKAQGYTVQTGVTLPGKCVTHEVDVLATNAEEQVMMECKFHNKHGYKTDVKVPLYIDSRFRDLKDRWSQPHLRHVGSIVTNSRFTEDAIAYGTCAGLKMISWDYPEKGSLRYTIERLQLQPITSLLTLTTAHKHQLIRQGIVLSKQLCTQMEVLDVLGLPDAKKMKVVAEANLVCELG